MRYSAFISYNHNDKREAGWLHRALETYRIPRRLRGRETPLGPLGSRLPPVFRDREELAASPDLAQSVRDALEVSGSLIVICSPNGARSQWVNEEIRAFTALGRRDRIQCLIVGGAVDGAAGDYLPPALLEGGASEPLAADLRQGADSRRDALLKLMAGMMAVPYDELRQRDQARRQRQLAIAAASLGLGFVVMSGLAITAFLARNEAIHQRDIARRKTETAERTVDFVKSLFDDADPSQARGATITAREILDRGSRQISQDLSDEPSVKAELETTLGDVYAGIGLFHQGETLIRQGLALSNVDVSTRARQYAALGDAQSRQSDYDGAIASYRRALKLSRDPDAAREDLTTRILVGLGEAQSELGEDAPAERTLAAALALDEKTLGPNDPSVARDLEALGPNDMAAGRLDEGKQRLQQALAIRLKTQGALHPRSAEDLNSLGAIAYLQADPVVAESYWRRALASYRTVLGDDHPEVATTMNNLALVELERRDFINAKPLLEHAIAVVVQQRNESFDDLAFEYENLGRVKRGLGDSADAKKLFLQALAVARKYKHRNLAPILVDLADMACARGDVKEGMARLDEAGPIMAATYPSAPWRQAWVQVIRGGCLAAQGQTAEAHALLEQNVPTLEKRWSPGSIYGVRAQQLLAAARARRA